MFPGKVGGVAHKELVVKPGTTASGGGRGAGASPSRGTEVDRRSVYSADTSSTSAAKKKLPKRRQLTELTKEELLDRRTRREKGTSSECTLLFTSVCLAPT